MSSGTLLDWFVFGCVVAGLLTLDLVVSARRGDQSVRAAFVWSGVWIVISAAFGGWNAARLGTDAAFTYYTAYLLEKSLSVDNLLMFGLVFVETGVSPKLQRKALLWGVLGALVMRAALIAPLSEFHIILDTRKAESRMTSTDLWDLASELKRLGAAFPGKTAVLCPLERFDKAGFFAISAQRMGFRISAFTSFEEAIEWLIADEVLI